MAGVGETETATIRATVKAVDMASRTVTLVGPQGEIKTLKVGPEVQNLAQLKAGDIVVARYRESVAYIIAPPGTKTPEDLLALAAVQAAPGEMPAAAAASKIVVTGHTDGRDARTARLPSAWHQSFEWAREAAGGLARTLPLQRLAVEGAADFDDAPAGASAPALRRVDIVLYP